MEKFAEWLRELPGKLADSVVIAAALALAAAVWTGLLIWSADVGLGSAGAVLGGLVASAAVVTAWNQLRAIDERAEAGRLAEPSPDQVEQRVRAWLYKYDFSVQRVEDATSDFNVSAQRGEAAAVHVIKGAKDQWLTIGAGADISDFVERIDWPRFHRDFVLGLSPLHLSYQSTKDERGRVREIKIVRNLPYTGLSDLDFLEAVRSVQAGVEVLKAVVNGALIPAEGTRGSEGSVRMLQVDEPRPSELDT